MEKSIYTKLQDLKKYIPVIDYLLGLDAQKYKKLFNIKQWIIREKKYPVQVLEKFERSIQKQYKNSFIDYDVKPPKEVMEIFRNTAAEVKFSTVNLCSDEEYISEDDDVEIVSVSAAFPTPVAVTTPVNVPTPITATSANENSLAKNTKNKSPSYLNNNEDNHDDEDVPEDELNNINHITKQNNSHNTEKESKDENISADGNLFKRRKDFITVSKTKKNTSKEKQEVITSMKENIQTERLISIDCSDADEETNCRKESPSRISEIDMDLLEAAARYVRGNEFQLTRANIDDRLNSPNHQQYELIDDNCLSNHHSCATTTIITTHSASNNTYHYHHPPSHHQMCPPSAVVPFHPPQLAQPASIALQHIMQKVNLKDPRVMKQLKSFQNSPLYSNATRAAFSSFTNAAMPYLNHATQQNTNPVPAATASISPITYGEHKRLKEKEAMEAKKAKEAKKAMEEKKAMESKKAKEAMEAQKALEAKKTKEEKAAKEAEERRVEEEKKKSLKAAAEATSNSTDATSNSTDATEKLMEKRAITNNDEAVKKHHRELKNLECSVTGYNQLRDYVPQTISGKRRSSVSARSAIAEQLNGRSLQIDTIDGSADDDDNQRAAAKINGKRRKSCANISSQFGITKRRKTIDAVLAEQIFPSATNLDLAKEIEKSKVLKKQPKVLLHRLTEADINQHIPPEFPKSVGVPVSAAAVSNYQIEDKQEIPATLPLLKIRMGDEKIPKKASNKKSKPTIEKETTAKSVQQQLKLANVHCRMTERNTVCCALCKSKPADLTNHYIRIHKTESYVSRLTSEEIAHLQVNIPTVTEVPSSKNGSSSNARKRHKVRCIFCDDELEDYFVNLYTHYSTHTGEYAFQCSVCKLQKPFRADIQSHQLHTKACRKHCRIFQLYQYHTHLTDIYLHYCKQCNFVQLNKANVFKHLRDHHKHFTEDPELVDKITLASVKNICASTDDVVGDHNDGDDTIVVANEPICEDTHIEENPLPTHSEHMMNSMFNAADDEYNEQKANRHTTIDKSEITLQTQGIVYPMPHVPMILQPDEDIKPDVNELQQTQIYLPSPLSADANLSKKSDASSSESSYLAAINDIRTKNSHIQRQHLNMPHLYYKSYPKDCAYFGLLKCMVIDCFFSTDVDDDMLHHLTNSHGQKSILDCPYCQLDGEKCSSADQLIAHVRKTHNNARFQCSECCYRSCDAGNVRIHLENVHNNSDLNEYLVYECAGHKVSINERLPQMIRAMSDNVQKIKCSYCSVDFYARSHMEEHLAQSHGMTTQLDEHTEFKTFACIYCTDSFHNQKAVSEHLALRHPNEFAYACERNLKAGQQTDSVHNLQMINVSLAVPQNAIPPPAFVNPANSSASNTLALSLESNCDRLDESKPNIKELIKCHEDAVLVLLNKLTKNTGLPPDKLYNCAHPNCSSIFSNYDLWSRHMIDRHYSLIATCPLCPKTAAVVDMPLIDFRAHFEHHHCQHLFVCFHCAITCVNQQLIFDHAAAAHNELSDFEVHKIPATMRLHPFHIIIAKSCHAALSPMEFLLELEKVFAKRLKCLEKEGAQKIVSQWSVPSTAAWLEDLENRLKCISSGCTFRTSHHEMLFQHLLDNHKITGLFNCTKCDFKVRTTTWAVILDHINMHPSNIYLCCVCKYNTHDRRQLSAHVQNDHDSRDVPVISLTRSLNNSNDVSLSIIYARGFITFSTLLACFCCPLSQARKLSVDAFMAHLKKSHDLTLKYLCELCDEKIPKLRMCEDHFQSKHNVGRDNLKIRCEIAASQQLTIVTRMPLCVRLGNSESIESSSEQAPAKPINIIAERAIKQENDGNESDDSVTIVEDDDLVVFEKLKESGNKKQITPRIKCTNITSLLNANHSQSHQSHTSFILGSSSNNMAPAPIQHLMPGNIPRAVGNCQNQINSSRNLHEAFLEQQQQRNLINVDQQHVAIPNPILSIQILNNDHRYALPEATMQETNLNRNQQHATPNILNNDHHYAIPEATIQETNLSGLLPGYHYKTSNQK